MKIELQINTRNLDLSDAFREEIQEKVEKLDKLYDRIMRCRVVVEMPHRHQHEGVMYNVHIYITVPGSELVIKRKPDKDLGAAIRDAFDAARRKLEDFVREQRGVVKHHEESPHASITKLFTEMGYGFLTTPDNREIYFHENSVVNRDFNSLKLGMKVRFVEEQGVKGPQASTVKVVGGRH